MSVRSFSSTCTPLQVICMRDASSSSSWSLRRRPQCDDREIIDLEGDSRCSCSSQIYLRSSRRQKCAQLSKSSQGWYEVDMKIWCKSTDAGASCQEGARRGNTTGLKPMDAVILSQPTVTVTVTLACSSSQPICASVRAPTAKHGLAF